MATTVLGLFWIWPSQAQATHVSCGDTITQDTTLDSDVVCGLLSEEHGLVVGADGITLDLNGHTVVADCSNFRSGVLNAGHTGVTITNGWIDAFHAVMLTGVSGNRLSDLTAGACVEGPAVYLSGSSGNVIENVLAASYRGWGIYLANSHRNRIVRSLGGGSWWIQLRDSNQNEIEQNSICCNDVAGISLVGSDNNRIERNSVYRSSSYRARLARGIVLNESDDNLISRNAVFENQLDGIYVLGSANTRVTHNVLRDNGRFEGPADGLFVDDSSERTVVKQNEASGNSDDGIDTDSASTKLNANTANNNGDLGIEAVPGTPGGGNKAFGNGNSLQCLNVRCK